MESILILLSTYNGEAFLREQLDSIFSQEGVDSQLLVRDDGSKDGSITILNYYKDKYPGKIDIIIGSNKGPASSFQELMHEALRYDFSYFAFCDQDDIWHPHKLETALDALLKDDKPCLFFSDYQMIDAEGKMLPTDKHHFKLTLGEALVMNPSVGCTQVFNRSLLEFACCKDIPNKVLHDWWIYVCCFALHGNIVYHEEPLIYYRQHGRNVLGGTKKSFLKKLQDWLYHKNNNLNSLLARDLYSVLAKEDKINRISRNDLNLIQLCSQYKSSPLKRIVLLLSHSKFKTNNSSVNKGFLLSVLFGKF